MTSSIQRNLELFEVAVLVQIHTNTPFRSGDYVLNKWLLSQGRQNQAWQI